MTTLTEVSEGLQTINKTLDEQSSHALDNTVDLINCITKMNLDVNRGAQTLSRIFGVMGKISRDLSKGKVNEGDDLERQIEQDAHNQKMLDILGQINKNLSEDKKEPSPEKSGGGKSFVVLGKFASIAAISIGAFAGAIVGAMKPLMFLTESIVSIVNKIRKFLTPKMLSSVVGMIGNMVKAVFELGIEKLKNGFNLVKSFLQSAAVDIGKKLKAIFTEGKLGKAVAFIGSKFKSVGELFTKIGKGFSSLQSNIEVLRKTLSFGGGGGSGGIFSKIGQTFTNLLAKFGSFGAALGNAFKLVSRLFAPVVAGIMLIKNIFETGFSFETVKNTIDDLVKFFIIDMADMIKNVISWISEKLGFTGISESLNSFKFADLYEDLKAFFVRLKKFFSFTNLGLLARGKESAMSFSELFTNNGEGKNISSGLEGTQSDTSSEATKMIPDQGAKLKDGTDTTNEISNSRASTNAVFAPSSNSTNNVNNSTSFVNNGLSSHDSHDPFMGTRTV